MSVLINNETKDGFTFLTDEAYLSFAKTKNDLIRITFLNGYDGMCDDWCFKDDLTPLIDALIKFRDGL